MFVNPNARVPVSHEGNTIYILAKMGLGVQAAVNDELVRIKLNLKKFTKGEGDSAEMRVGARTQDLVTLKHNIKKWEGPAFTIVYQYDEKKNPDGRSLPFAPLADLTQDMVSGLSADEVDELDASPFYLKQSPPRPIPCSPGRIEELEDFEHPLIAAVLDEIKRRNPHAFRTEDEEKNGPVTSKASRTDGTSD